MRGCRNDEERHELLRNMRKSIEQSKKSEQWTKDNGKYIPMPSTWLNQRRWEDEGLVKSDPSERTSTLAKSLSKALKI